MILAIRYGFGRDLCSNRRDELLLTLYNVVSAVCQDETRPHCVAYQQFLPQQVYIPIQILVYAASR